MQNYSFRDIEIRANKELRNSLSTIWGVGVSRADFVLSRLGFRYPYWAANLNYSLFNEIAFLLNKLLLSKVKGQRTINIKVKDLIELQTLRGRRHALHLPTRGQRTRTNGRTVKRLFRINFAKIKDMAKANKRSLLSQRKRFVFLLHRRGKRQMLLFLRKSFTNIFLTLTDLNKRVVYALSAGECVEKNNRRGKVIPFVIESMVVKIIKILAAFKIKVVTIIMRTSLRVHMRILVSKLLRERYQIASILDRRITAHNGVRARAVKRR